MSDERVSLGAAGDEADGDGDDDVLVEVEDGDADVSGDESEGGASDGGGGGVDAGMDESSVGEGLERDGADEGGAGGRERVYAEGEGDGREGKRGRCRVDVPDVGSGKECARPSCGGVGVGSGCVLATFRGGSAGADVLCGPLCYEWAIGADAAQGYPGA